MNCKICYQKSKFLFELIILNKINATYFRCCNCGFIQTEVPYWLEEAYSSAISAIDVGLVRRNLVLSDKVEVILRNDFDISEKFLDYGGGYGLFVRLMRDKGFDFYREDPYCKNLFSTYWDLKHLPEKSKFEIVTAFEVFEHLEDPQADLFKLLSFSDSILFTTELQPQSIEELRNWWYFLPEGGQHISFFTSKSLKILAEQNGCFFYSNDCNIHLISKRRFNYNILKDNYKLNIKSRILRRVLKFFKESRRSSMRESLLSSDFEFSKLVATGKEDVKNLLKFYSNRNDL